MRRCYTYDSEKERGPNDLPNLLLTLPPLPGTVTTVQEMRRKMQIPSFACGLGVPGHAGQGRQLQRLGTTAI